MTCSGIFYFENYGSKNLFESDVMLEIIDCINKLTPQIQHLWGKMDAAQMLAHCQMPPGVAVANIN